MSIDDNYGYYGYYQVNDKIYVSKHHALVAANFDYWKIKFIWHDDKFSSFDWTREPEPQVSIKEFYKRRAIQLREKYDYLILMFSGGPDSTNMLNAFIDNGIHIDEIVNVNSFDRTQIVNQTIHNADYVYNVKPYLDNLIKESNFQTKITIVDEIELVKQHWKHHEKIDHWEPLFGAIPAPSMIMTKIIWIKYVPHLWKMVKDGVNLGIIIGHAKASLEVKNNKYTTSFTDMLGPDTTTYCNEEPELKGRNLMDFFYSSPNAVELSIKQAHVLKNYMESHRTLNFFTDPKLVDDAYKKGQRRAVTCESKYAPGHHLRYDLFHQILYPGLKQNFITPKTSLLTTRPEDNWWFHNFDYNDKKIFLHGIAKVKNYIQWSGMSNIGWDGKSGQSIEHIPLRQGKLYYLE
jgi:hypothetical protein